MTFPALELVWSPTGSGSVVQGHAWPLGSVAPLPEAGLSFGIEGDVRVPYPPKKREFFKIDRRHGRLRLSHLCDGYRVPVNGRVRVERELELFHRDLLLIPRGPLIRVLDREVVVARSPALEAALKASPFDAEVLHVYRDFLLDQGDPLGERMARSKGVSFDDDAVWFDALAPHYETGDLQVEWREGLAEKAVLRQSLAMFDHLDEALTHLFALPVMRFLRELTLEVASDRLTVSDGLQALEAVKLPETLKRISLGDVPENERARALLALEKFHRPVEVGYYADAMLEVLSSSNEAAKAGDALTVGEHIELGPTGFSSYLSHNVLLGGSYIIARDGPRFVLARIVGDAVAPKVNGRLVERFPLREGDIIELAGDLTARFKYRR